MKKKIFVFLFNGFSDWEIAFFTPEICKNDEFELVYFSIDGREVVSMGGMTVKPSVSLNEMPIDAISMLVLPGGTAWEENENTAVEVLVKKVFEKGKPLAAICAATVFLAQLGLLDYLKHTSNDLNYLKSLAPNYSGDKYYQNTLAVVDEGVITANGISPIEFAREIFKTIALNSETDIEKWFQLFKNGIWSE